MDPFVAYIDILGFGDLMFAADVKQAVKIWEEFYQDVEGAFSVAINNVEIFGINDGFWVRGPDIQQLCACCITLYRRWFDKRGNSLAQLPLLRGAIVKTTEDKIYSGTSTCVKRWLMGPGVATSVKYERLFRGGRLFVHHTLFEEHGIPANMVYKWQEITEWGNVQPNIRLWELVWPLDEKLDLLLDRLKMAENLYREALGAQRRVESKDIRLFLQYDETIKLVLRACGKFVSEHAKEADTVLRNVVKFLDYSEINAPEYTWGLTFVSLEAMYLSNQEIDPHYFKTALEFLKGAKPHDGLCRIEDFRKELKRSSYRAFQVWLTSRCPELIE